MAVSGAGRSAKAPANPQPSLSEKIVLVRWHLDRYDKLRSSTASRAAVVLSAGALLSAANAVVIVQLLRVDLDRPSPLALASCVLVGLVSFVLIVLAVIRASGVLVTGRDTRRTFAHLGALPLGLIFNGTDTVAHVRSFEEFSAVFSRQTEADILKAAQVELWVCIQQHRRRYLNLRSSVRILQYASVSLLVLLVLFVAMTLSYRVF